jgi:hypothetical protein
VTCRPNLTSSEQDFWLSISLAIYDLSLSSSFEALAYVSFSRYFAHGRHGFVRLTSIFSLRPQVCKFFLTKSFFARDLSERRFVKKKIFSSIFWSESVEAVIASCDVVSGDLCPHEGG